MIDHEVILDNLYEKQLSIDHEVILDYKYTIAQCWLWNISRDVYDISFGLTVDQYI